MTKGRHGLAGAEPGDTPLDGNPMNGADLIQDDQAEEHDAYYLASASLLPRRDVQDAVSKRRSAADIAKRFGPSPELVEYRIKRLGLWREHVGKKVALAKS